MFFKYTWNNFLHTQVEICIALILASPFENAENGTITDQDSTGDNLLLKHVSIISSYCGLRVWSELQLKDRLSNVQVERLSYHMLISLWLVILLITWT